MILTAFNSKKSFIIKGLQDIIKVIRQMDIWMAEWTEGLID